MASRIVSTLTPYSNARSRTDVSPRACRARASSTIDSVSFAPPCLSPRTTASGFVRLPCAVPRGRRSGCCRIGFRSPVSDRPLRTMSRLLSNGVPRKRWAGFTQAGLSPFGQLWQANSPGGMGPRNNSHATDGAVTHEVSRPMRKLICPWPYGPLRPVHGQHSAGPPRSTRAQKRAMKEGVYLGRMANLQFAVPCRGLLAQLPGLSVPNYTIVSLRAPVVTRPGAH